MKKIIAGIVLSLGLVGAANAEMSQELKALKATSKATTQVIVTACIKESKTDEQFNECTKRYMKLFKTEFDKALAEQN
ncbi:hypothetical protein JRU19_002942 [Escherichia coli]|nr:hypothetical protein [Escherichia coli]